MKWLVNLIAKLAGLKDLFQKFNGYKSYISGAALILTGLAGILNGLVGVNDAAELLQFLKTLGSSSDWVVLMNGLGIVGLRHAASKKD